MAQLFTRFPNYQLQHSLPTWVDNLCVFGQNKNVVKGIEAMNDELVIDVRTAQVQLI
jgi:hypothetical protein